MLRRCHPWAWALHLPFVGLCELLRLLSGCAAALAAQVYDKNAVMDDDTLEKIIADLVKRKWDDATGEAERAMLNRVLNGLRYKYEMAGPIWESLDEFWHATPP